MSLVNDAPGLKSVRGGLAAAVALELGAPQRHQSAEVRGRRGAIDETQCFLGLQVEDVTRAVEQIQLVEAAAQLDEDAPHPAEQARALEAKVLPVANPSARVGQDAGEDQP